MAMTTYMKLAKSDRDKFPYKIRLYRSIHEDHTHWLSNNVGDCNIMWSFDFWDNGICFINQEDAVLFKLTWG